MSDLSGADLDQLDALASSYQQRGAAIAERALDLNRRVVEAVTTFQTSLSDLRTRTTAANDALLDDIDGLARTAAATTWTGANRTAFDTDLAVLQQGVTATTTALTTRIGQLEHGGVAPFTDILTTFGRQASGAGAAAEQTGASLRTRVTEQRQSLQDAADLGWSAV